MKAERLLILTWESPNLFLEKHGYFCSAVLRPQNEARDQRELLSRGYVRAYTLSVQAVYRKQMAALVSWKIAPVFACNPLQLSQTK